jgi:hypothetical protein
MNDLQKYLSKSLLAAAVALVGASPAWAQVSLGAASGFSVLGGTNVTCTAPGSVVGDVGVAPGSAVSYTNTNCVIAGAVPPETDAAAVLARADFLGAYAALKATTCTDISTLASATITGPVTLFPGVYCTDTALTGAGELTLDAQGDANAVWIFNIGAALTGTNFSVFVANGAQPCNVYWVPSAAVTMTTSALSGNILAGDDVGGSITMTGGTVAGRVLANVAVTMTGANVIGCSALSVPPSGPPSTCKDKDRDHDGHDKDKHDKKCNQGVGNGPEGCDPGKSDHGTQYPFGSNDEDGGTKGEPGHKGGKN